MRMRGLSDGAEICHRLYFSLTVEHRSIVFSFVFIPVLGVSALLVLVL
jgi:hypothetical protein